MKSFEIFFYDFLFFNLKCFLGYCVYFICIIRLFFDGCDVWLEKDRVEVKVVIIN